MPDERDLRELFAHTPAAGAIDTEAVIARTRRRRLPRRLAAGSIGALAVVGITVLGVQTMQPMAQQPTQIALEQPDTAAPETFAEDSALKRAPADKLNLCEGTLADVAPSATGLQLDPAFPATAPADGATITGAVTLTNVGTQRVTGTTSSSPAVTVSQGGIVLWHSNGPVDAAAIAVDLAPGQSLTYAATVVPVRCSVEDDASEAFRADLPALPPGVYQLSAAIDFAPSVPTATTELELITGPHTDIALH